MGICLHQPEINCSARLNQHHWALGAINISLGLSTGYLLTVLIVAFSSNKRIAKYLSPAFPH